MRGGVADPAEHRPEQATGRHWHDAAIMYLLLELSVQLVEAIPLTMRRDTFAGFSETSPASGADKICPA
jgi:hypothetical protein